MKFIKSLGIASLALLALGALTASAASAHAWEIKKEPIIENRNVTGTATLQFEEKHIGAQLTCKLTSKGIVKHGGLGEITSITSNTGAKEIPCENNKPLGCSAWTIEAKILPWKTELATIGGELRNKIFTTTELVGPQWTIRCQGFSDICEASPNAALKNYSKGVEAIYGAKSPATSCAEAPAGTFTTKGTEDITLNGGEVLSAS